MFLIRVLQQILKHGSYALTPLFSNEHSSLMSVASSLSMSFLDTRISKKFKSLFLVFWKRVKIIFRNPIEVIALRNEIYFLFIPLDYP